MEAPFSVSDLHLGGEPGAQIFDQGTLLAETVRRVARRRSAWRWCSTATSSTS